jgi:hypothetical protein
VQVGEGERAKFIIAALSGIIVLVIVVITVVDATSTPTAVLGGGIGLSAKPGWPPDKKDALLDADPFFIVAGQSAPSTITVYSLPASRGPTRPVASNRRIGVPRSAHGPAGRTQWNDGRFLAEPSEPSSRI